MPNELRPKLTELADQLWVYVEGGADPTGAYQDGAKLIEAATALQRLGRPQVLAVINALHAMQNQTTDTERWAALQEVAAQLGQALDQDADARRAARLLRGAR